MYKSYQMADLGGNGYRVTGRVTLRGVYMIPGRLSHRREFTPVPSLISEFVYMIPPKNAMLGRLTPARVHPGCCTGAKISFQRGTTTRSGVKSTSRWAGTGSACVAHG